MRVLLVEDDQRVASFIRRGLTAERFIVDVAGDGQQGLDLAVSKDYDLLILDLMLPNLGGQEVLRTIRKSNRTIPVLILTAKGAIKDKVELFEKGCDDYLTKPFAFAELLARVKALLRRGTIEAREVIQVADLCIELKRRTVISERERELS